MGFGLICEATDERMHGPRQECAWADEQGWWTVFVDSVTGAAFTASVDLDTDSHEAAYVRAAWKATK